MEQSDTNEQMDRKPIAHVWYEHFTIVMEMRMNRFTFVSVRVVFVSVTFSMCFVRRREKIIYYYEMD